MTIEQTTSSFTEVRLCITTTDRAREPLHIHLH